MMQVGKAAELSNINSLVTARVVSISDFFISYISWDMIKGVI